MTKNETLTAIWDGEQYVCGDWTSSDGDNWITGAGGPVTDPTFAVATIRLRGGQRNGETVA